MSLSVVLVMVVVFLVVKEGVLRTEGSGNNSKRSTRQAEARELTGLHQLHHAIIIACDVQSAEYRIRRRTRRGY